MGEARRELDGDPEAMRFFADHVIAPRDVDAIPQAPDWHVCAGGIPACGTFAAADIASTMTLAGILAETEDAIAALRTAARLSAAEYAATDQAGAVEIAGALRALSRGEG